jgi:hypothetical protein
MESGGGGVCMCAPTIAISSVYYSNVLTNYCYFKYLVGAWKSRGQAMALHIVVGHQNVVGCHVDNQKQAI